VVKSNRALSDLQTDPTPPTIVGRSLLQELIPGRVVAGRYTLRARLGQGGMGSVWRAHDRELEEEIALKVLLPAWLEEPSMRERLRREVKIARRITHLNVCRVFDYGEDGDLHFLTMELIEGRTLRAILVSGELDPGQALALVRQITDGIAAAHAQGIVHRDLKPENVIVRRDGRVVVADFGLAHGPLTDESIAAGLEGTLAYMSPEQLRGEPLDVRSDIFALGILAFEALTGRSPFEAGSKAATISAILRDPPRPLEVPALAAEVALMLRAILARAMAKAPEDRYASAAELGAAIAGAQEALRYRTTERGLTLSPRTSSLPPSLRENRGSRRLGLLAGAAAVVSLLGVASWRLGGSIWPWSTGGEPSAAVGASLETPGERPLSSGGAGAREDARPGVLVMPLENLTGEPSWDGLAKAAGEAIRTGLRAVPQVHLLDASPVGQPGADPAQAGAAWIAAGSVQRIGDSLRLTAQLRTAGGALAGEPVEIEGDTANPKGLLEPLKQGAIDEVRLLLRDFERRQQAQAGTRNEGAKARLLQYYDLVGLAPRAEHLVTGGRLLDEALAADARYVPALVERAHLRLVSASSQAKREAHATALADVEQALALAPGEPRALLLRCRLMQIEVHMDSRATDAGIAAAMSACTAALQADPSSARAHLVLSRLHHRACDMEMAMTTLERALELDRSEAGGLLTQLTHFALEDGRMTVADRASKQLAAFYDEEKRLGARAYSRRAGVSPTHGAHVHRGAVLIRLGRLEEAHAELAGALDIVSSGVGDRWNEAAALRGIHRIAELRGQRMQRAWKERLDALEQDYRKVAKDKPHVILALATTYRWVNPGAALEWLNWVAPPASFDDAFERALFYHAAGKDREARRSIEARPPTQQWERDCREWIESRLSR
jgi:serine/threonine protein kinase/TolB-like protein/tetratricopeptide (TPR) repeat protein